MKRTVAPGQISIIVAALALGMAIPRLGAAQQAASAPAATAQQPDSAQINSLLSEAKVESGQLERDAHELMTFQRSSLSWSSHNQQLERMRQQINKIGQLDRQLRDLRHAGSPWQQAAIDRVNPALRELADNLQATIQHASERPSQLHLPAFRDLVAANASLAQDLNATIRDAVDYGKRKQAFEAAAQRFTGSKTK